MKHKKKIILLTIIFCSILIIIVSSTFAKYVYNSAWSYYLHSRGFYFYSDSLNNDNKKNSILKWDGTDIKFEIRNNENDNLVSEYDISYTVTCEVLNEEKEYLSCNLNNTGESTSSGKLSSSSKCIDEKGEKNVDNLIKSECELSGYTWKNEVTNKEISFNLELKDETKAIDEVSVQIKVESTYPYKKVLKGVYNLNLIEEQMEYELDFQNFSAFGELTIINKLERDKCFYISFDEKELLYNNFSSEVIETYDTKDGIINKLKVKIKSNTSSVFDFYKIIPENEYSLENFTLEEIEC